MATRRLRNLLARQSGHEGHLSAQISALREGRRDLRAERAKLPSQLSGEAYAHLAKGERHPLRRRDQGERLAKRRRRMEREGQLTFGPVDHTSPTSTHQVIEMSREPGSPGKPGRPFAWVDREVQPSPRVDRDMQRRAADGTRAYLR